jgi:phage terminase small subunit
MDKKLTPKQQRFIDEYLIDLNASRAALTAGYSPKTAPFIGAENLKKPQIQAALNVSLQRQQQRTEITADWTLREIHKLAKFNAKKLFNSDGSLIPIQDLDDDTAACIGGIDVSQSFSGSGEDRQVETIKKVKIWDKGQALDKLAKHFGLYAEDNKRGLNEETLNLILASMPPEMAADIKNRLVDMAKQAVCNNKK